LSSTDILRLISKDWIMEKNPNFRASWFIVLKVYLLKNLIEKDPDLKKLMCRLLDNIKLTHMNKCQVINRKS